MLCFGNKSETFVEFPASRNHSMLVLQILQSEISMESGVLLPWNAILLSIKGLIFDSLASVRTANKMQKIFIIEKLILGWFTKNERA